MATLIFKKDSDASTFASRLLEVHDKTQICYKYERDCEVEFWWEFQTDMCSDERINEYEERAKIINGLFSYLDDKKISYR